MQINVFHPMVVHFPIALILLGFLLELIAVLHQKDVCYNKAARILLVFGTAGALVACITGAFTPNFTGRANDVEDIHHIFATLTTVLLCLATVIYVYIGMYRDKTPKYLSWVGFSLYGAAAVCVAITGYYGGFIVYNVLL